jgi:hypothetical protein
MKWSVSRQRAMRDSIVGFCAGWVFSGAGPFAAGSGRRLSEAGEPYPDMAITARRMNTRQPTRMIHQAIFRRSSAAFASCR